MIGTHMQDIPNILYSVVFLLLWLLLISLPGIALTYLGWKFSRSVQPIWARNLLRATVIALCLTPSVYGHAGPMPAIFVVFSTFGRDRLIGMVPILIVWAVAVSALGVFARESAKGQ